jgi:hypothetical protein
MDTPSGEEAFVNDKAPVSWIFCPLLRVFEHNVKDLNDFTNAELGPRK